LNQPEIAIAALQEDARTEPIDPHIHRILAEAYASIHLPEEALQSAQATVQVAQMILKHYPGLLTCAARSTPTLKLFRP